MKSMIDLFEKINKAHSKQGLNPTSITTIDEKCSKRIIDKYSKDVVILDYLITSKQLLEMLCDGENYEKFSRKSKIEEIV